MGNNIASERKRLGMTQDELAKKLKSSRSAVIDWESGAAIKSSTMCAMADMFGCSLDYLMGRTEERTPRI